MYANLAKGQAVPLAIRVCAKPRWAKPFHTSKPQSLQIGCHLKPSINLSWGSFTNRTSHLVHSSAGSYSKILENGIVAKPRSVFSGLRLRSRGFSSWSSQKVNGGGGVGRSGKRLPWLPAAKGAKGVEKTTSTKTPISSWEESAKMLEKLDGDASLGESPKSMNVDSARSSWDKSAKNSREETRLKTGRSSWEASVDTVVGRSGALERESKESRTGRVSRVNDRKIDFRGRDRRLENSQQSDYRGRDRRLENNGQSDFRGRENRLVTNRQSEFRERDRRLENNQQSDYRGRDQRVEKADTEGAEEEDEEEMEAVDDPRWDRIQNQFRRIDNENPERERPDFRRWNRQEDWGKKTWKEATESSVPRLIGQGVYGVGPVLAALSAGRREFYALYIQEGLDLSKNNRKKKDKKGFERILMMAEKIGLSIKDVAKHDLNMATDNRPHQGLVLDASPLEMVKIKELDPVSAEEDKDSLWVALDEVTDPQNVGAIIRSAYFFGASGVVLCAKNSAPLSGVVSKASAGSLELMELRYCKNMMQFLTSSAENGWRVLGGSVSSRALPLNEVAPSVPTILVLGSEGTGLRPLVERSCTDLIRIPGNIPVEVTAGGLDDIETAEEKPACSAEEFRSFLAVESLNVSVAAGVLLHHLTGSNNKKDTQVVNLQTDELD